MGFLAGKKLLITGVLSNRSIAYGIARACHQQGAALAFSYAGERFKERITDFAAEFGLTLAGHPGGEQPRGQSPRLENDHLAIAQYPAVE